MNDVRRRKVLRWTTRALERCIDAGERAQAGDWGDSAGLFPFAGIAPRTLDANIRYRRAVLDAASDDPDVQRGLVWMCKRDFLFYVNTFLFTLDPRDKFTPVRPFITWDFQDEASAELIDALGNEDVLFLKSRDMGATWLCVAAIEWSWHFHGYRDWLLTSKDMNALDSTSRKGTLMYKFDFIHRHEPTWLLPAGRELGWDDDNRNLFRLRNADLDGVVFCASPSGELGSGDRTFGGFLDEFSKIPAAAAGDAADAMRDVTDCRIFNFTPWKTGFAARQLARTGIRKIRMHWSAHPLKKRGLYRLRDDDTVELIDRKYWEKRCLDQGLEHEPDKLAEVCATFYKFAERFPEFKLRSPWFDRQCLRARRAFDIKQNLEISFESDEAAIFDEGTIERLIRERGKRPFHTGRLEFDEDTLEPTGFVDDPRGTFKLWFAIGADRRPADHTEYVVGVDCAQGGNAEAGRPGASNSVITVMNKTERRVVAQFASAMIQPAQLARLAIAVCKWFSGRHGPALLIWEHQGPGTTFADEVTIRRYRNVYTREKATADGTSRSREIGFHTNASTKPQLIERFRAAIEGETLDCPSVETLEECLCYIMSANGMPEYQSADTEADSSGAKKNHGDRVMSVALCWWIMRGDHEVVAAAKKQVAPEGSYARVAKEWEREERSERKPIRVRKSRIPYGVSIR